MIFQQKFVFEKGRLRLKKSKASIIPCRLSSSDTINNYQPVKVNGEKGNQIIQRLNQMSSLYGIQIQKNGSIS